jgi:quercetin dioxygenase-like cupin family protein
MIANTPATLRQPSEGRTIAVVGDIYRFLAVGAETGGKFAIWEAIVPPGGGPPPHVHSREDESFYILEGEMTFQIGTERLVAGVGTYAHLLAGVRHSFKNESGRLAKMLISVAPAGLEEMFLEVGAPVAPGTTEAPLPSQAELAKLAAIASRFGVTLEIPQH